MRITIYFLDRTNKKDLSITSLQADKSYISTNKNFPHNIEIQAIKTYEGGSRPLTFELNSSMVLLPVRLMRPRLADDRVGFFTTGYVDFDGNPQGVKNKKLITRWRLEPKLVDREKYLRGELVEPQKQIVYYIDPATPKKWIPIIFRVLTTGK